MQCWHSRLAPRAKVCACIHAHMLKQFSGCLNGVREITLSDKRHSPLCAAAAAVASTPAPSLPPVTPKAPACRPSSPARRHQWQQTVQSLSRHPTAPFPSRWHKTLQLKPWARQMESGECPLLLLAGLAKNHLGSRDDSTCACASAGCGTSVGFEQPSKPHQDTRMGSLCARGCADK